MKRVIFTVLTPILFSGILFSGGCGGGGAKVESSTTTTTTTMGKELLELDEAHKKDIINDEEYNKAKQQIMNRYKK